MQHAALLPAEHEARIPQIDRRVLKFILAYLAEDYGNVSTLIVGGYVRDLLLGKEPDDLDLSFCLRECSDEATMASVFGFNEDEDSMGEHPHLDEGIGHFAEMHPEFGVTAVKPAIMKSDETKNKNVDTAKMVLVMVDGDKFEVDLMPTIGEEVRQILFSCIALHN